MEHSTGLRYNELNITFITSPISNFGDLYQMNYGRRELNEYMYTIRNESLHQNDLVIINENNQVQEKLEHQVNNRHTNIIFICTSELFTIVEPMISSYSNVLFVKLGGTILTPRTNLISIHVNTFEASYIAGYLAGLVTNTNKLGWVKPYTNHQIQILKNSFYMGAKKSNSDIELFKIISNEGPNQNLKEQLISEIFKANDIDMAIGQSPGETLFQELNGIGIQYDFSVLSGDNVFTSFIPYWIHPYFDVIDRYIQNNISDSMIYGMDFKDNPSVDISRISNKVPKFMREKVIELRNTIVKDGFNFYCGPLHFKNGSLQLKDGECVSSSSLYTMEAGVFNETDLGTLEFPETYCEPGTYFEFNTKENKINCIPCEPGSYSETPQSSCVPCPIDTYSDKENSKICVACSIGYTAPEGSKTCQLSPFNIYSWFIIAIIIVVFLYFILTIISCTFLIIFVLLKLFQKNIKEITMTDAISSSIVGMKLDDDHITKMFSIEKPTKLEQQLQKIVRNLRMYRPYLPDTLLSNSNKKKQEKKEKKKRRKNYMDKPSTSSSKSLHSGSSGSSVSSNSSTSENQWAKLKKNMGIKLKQSNCTIMVVTLTNLNYVLSNYSPANFCSQYTRAMNILIDQVKATSGVVVSILGEQIICSWNAFTHIQFHAVNGANASINFIEKLTKFQESIKNVKMPILKFTCAVFTGDCLSGTMGTSKLRSFAVVGPMINNVFAVSRLNTFYNTQILVNKECFDLVSEKINGHLVDKITVKSHQHTSRLSILNLFEIYSPNYLSQKLNMNDEKGETSIISEVLENYEQALVVFYQQNQSLATNKLRNALNILYVNDEFQNENQPNKLIDSFEETLEPIDYDQHTFVTDKTDHPLGTQIKRFLERATNGTFQNFELVLNSIPKS